MLKYKKENLQPYLDLLDQAKIKQLHILQKNTNFTISILVLFIEDQLLNFYQKKLGLFSYSLDEKRELNNDSLQAELGEITNNYDHYIEKEMKNNDQILGEDKIINTVKKEYFANNMYF